MTDFEKEIKALLRATLEQQTGVHEVLKGRPDYTLLTIEDHIALLESIVEAHQVVLLRLAREVGALRGE